MDQNLKTMNEIESARKVVEMVMGVDILKKSRKRQIVEARMVFSLILREKGFTYKTIGRVFGKDHTTIIHYIHNVSKLLDVDELLMKKYLKCRDVLIVNEHGVNLFSESKTADEIKRLTIVADVLKKENHLLTKENEELKKELELGETKRLLNIFKLIKKHTPIGNEFLMERKIRKMLDE